MKHNLIGIFFIAMMVQVSLGGPLKRFKRNDQTVKGLKDLYHLSRDVLKATEPAVRDALRKIPKTAAYYRYSNELEGYLEDYQQYKTKPGPCLDKTFELFQHFIDIIEKYDNEAAPAEAKRVSELLKEYSDVDLENNLDEWEAKFKETDFEEEMKHVDAKDALTMSSVMTEVC